MTDLGLRQIHLDFHTSGVIDGVAGDFDAVAFADRLAAAHVTSVNVFAKCHHGYSYYPTRVGTAHPGLVRDLLGEQIAALRERGILAPVYVSVLWDDLAGEQHPEWVAQGRDGRVLARPPLTAESLLDGGTGWSVMDLDTGYADYVVAQVREICERYTPDGFWFDIVSVVPSYSSSALARMRTAGVDVSDEAAVEAHYLRVRDAFVARLAATIREVVPSASIVANHTVDAWLAGTLEAQTQLDVESLPTSGGAWGYTHYPVYARYARTFGRPIVGMTGRFHRSWADFGGLKTTDQLQYEVGTILAAGGGVCVGDQLDPSGVLDGAVYRTVGTALGHVRDLEPWLVGASPVTEAAVIASWVDASPDPGRHVRVLSAGVTGACQILGELAIQHDVVDASRVQPGRYALLVVPDDADLSEADAASLDKAVDAGAALLIAGDALFHADGSPRLSGAPASRVGTVATTPAYVRPGELADRTSGELAADYAYVCYNGALAVHPSEGADTVGLVLPARFDRTWDHFTSHGHAPVSDEVAGPAVCRKGRVTHVAIPVFSDYAQNDYWVEAEIVRRCLAELLPDRVVTHDGPPWVEVAVHGQPVAPGRPERRVVHLTAFQSRRLSTPVPRVDRGHDIVGFDLRLALGSAPSAAYLAPSGTPVPTDYTDGIAVVHLDRVAPSTVLVVEAS